MASSLQGKAEPEVRRVTADEAVVHPEDARPTDESPTVISKTPPLLEPLSSTKQKIDLNRRPSTPDSLVASVRGKRLAHYELIEPIGVGGMAAVIRARDTQLDRFVALKILPPEMADEAENVDRFHQEARAAAKLDHENIARVFFCGADQGLHFIAFEFVEGINLRTMLEQRTRIPVAEAVRYILQVATGLEHASARGVVHRDVKPSNIIVTPNGRAKLVDMGLARNLERGERDLTQSGVTLGTFDYISPEQALEPREADARSDIYSLGCTFYHLLTGVPPVPEGTPAKKLDHHQHHSPTDPRQFNPKIPTEIVMILGKMMAKKPSDRYQRPIHLVQHLMQVAQDVGAANDLPEGVMFVDAPLPGQMRKRPLLAIGLGLAALVSITLLMSMFADPAPPKRAGVISTNSDKKGDAPKSEPNAAQPKKNPASPGARVATVTNRAQLQQLFDDAAVTEINADLDGAVDLEGGVHFQAAKDQRFELVAADNYFHRLFFQFTRNNNPDGLKIEGGESVVFRNIRFQIDSNRVWPEDRTVAAMITLRGVKTVEFKHCVFAQPKVPGPAPKRGPIASIFIDTPADAEHARPIITLTDCLFESTPQESGQVAIAINGAATVNLTNCALMPHAALIQFRKDCRKEFTSVHLRNCDGFVVNGPAFRFNAKASASIHASKNVFTRPVDSPLPRAHSPEMVMVLPQAGLIFLPEEAAVAYVGDNNLYHNLMTFIERPSKEGQATIAMEARADFLAKNKGSDTDSKVLAREASPHQRSTAPAADLESFQLKYEYHQSGVGLRSLWTGAAAVPGPATAKVQPMPKAREKIVDADDDGKTPGVRASLSEALAGAEDGDVILVKHGDDKHVIVRPVEMKPGISVIVKPYKDYEPILIMDSAYKDLASFLFKVRDGKLQIENMEILLEPESAKFAMQSIVHLGETAHCVFKNCHLTLHATNSVPLNVVTFLDLNNMMKPEAVIPSNARVEFHDCFVRGKGDLVGLIGCRLLHVEMKNSFVALEGSLLDIQAAKVVPMNQGVRWKMERSSVFTTESVFAFHSIAGRGLTETQADVDGCLFVSLAANQAVVDLSVDFEATDKYLKWKGEQNFYGNFDMGLMRDWLIQYPQANSQSKTFTFAEPKKLNLKELWTALPDWFKPIETEAAMLSEFGIPAAVQKGMIPPSSKSDEP